MRERPDDHRDIAARRRDFLRHRDRVAVVLHEVDDRQALAARGVERFPELALGGGPFAERDVGDLVRVVPRLAAGNVGEAVVEAAGLGAADRVKALRARGAALGDDVDALVAPVRGHLPAARGRVVLRADGLQQHLVRRDAEGEAERPVTVVGEEPVVAGPERARRRDEHRLVPGAADLEEDLALVLELDLLVVQLSRQDHPAIGCEQGGTRRLGPFHTADRRRRCIHAAARCCRNYADP